MTVVVDLKRRSFLRWSVLSGMGVLVGWRFFLPAKGDHFEGLRSLSQTEARVLAAVYAAVTNERSTKAIQEAVRFMDGFVRGISTRDRRELWAGLTLLEHSPLIFHGEFPRFTRLDDAGKRMVLEGWRDGALWRRPLFSALKDLSFLAFYRRRSTWKGIGYDGPLVPFERKAGPADLSYIDLLVPEERSRR